MERMSKVARTCCEINESISCLKTKMISIEREKFEKSIVESMRKENEELERTIQKLKERLDELEKVASQVSHSELQNLQQQFNNKIQQSEFASNESVSESTINNNPKIKKDQKNKKNVNQENSNKEKIQLETPVDIGRLDLKVGKIVEIKKHPDADSLFVEQIDIGKTSTITVVSGLVKHVPIDEMQNRLVIVLCNMKPAKMRGVTSEGMVMCASTPEKVEVLSPPSGSVPGDIVVVEGYDNKPDSILNPKKKIFETVAPDLKTDSNCVATYKGVKWLIKDKGNVTTQSLVGANIK